jgi:hypothetical protein
MVALKGELGSDVVGVTEMLVIFPQKEKKFVTSLSEVPGAMLET